MLLDDPDVEPTEVRTRLLEQHEGLRRMLREAIGVALRLLAGEAVSRDLERRLRELRSAYAAHNHYEETVLEPLLIRDAGVGPARIARMLEEHVAEHRELEAFLTRPAAEIAPDLVDFVEQLEAHMQAEERTFLSPRALSA